MFHPQMTYRHEHPADTRFLDPLLYQEGFGIVLLSRHAESAYGGESLDELDQSLRAAQRAARGAGI